MTRSEPKTREQHYVRAESYIAEAKGIMRKVDESHRSGFRMSEYEKEHLNKRADQFLMLAQVHASLAIVPEGPLE